MVYEYKLYDYDLNYIETVYMTETEFTAYVSNKDNVFKYSREPASEAFQK